MLHKLSHICNFMWYNIQQLGASQPPSSVFPQHVHSRRLLQHYNCVYEKGQTVTVPVLGHAVDIFLRLQVRFKYSFTVTEYAVYILFSKLSDCITVQIHFTLTAVSEHITALTTESVFSSVCCWQTVTFSAVQHWACSSTAHKVNWPQLMWQWCSQSPVRSFTVPCRSVTMVIQDSLFSLKMFAWKKRPANMQTWS